MDFELTNYLSANTATNFQVQIKTLIGSNIKNCRISYLAVDPTFTDPFSISYSSYVIIFLLSPVQNTVLSAVVFSSISQLVLVLH